MRRSGNLDKFAIILTGVCLLHCLAIPVFLTLAPIISISSFVDDLLFHQLMLWLVVPSSAIALYVGCRNHRNTSILISGGVGLLLLFTAAVLGHDILSSRQEKIVTILGGLVLAFSHYLNYRACQKITCSSKNCSSEHHH